MQSQAGERRQAILRLLTDGPCTLTDLAETLHWSPHTIEEDLYALRKDGKVIMTRARQVFIPATFVVTVLPPQRGQQKSNQEESRAQATHVT